MTTEERGAPKGAQDFRTGRAARSLYPAEFSHVGEWGVAYSPYNQLEEVGFSLERLAEERSNRELDGQVFIIAGTSEGGMGEALAIEIARQGGTSVCVSRKAADDPEVARIMERVKAAGSQNSVWMQANLADDEQRRRIVPATEERFGRIDGLALVAAKINDKGITDYTDEEIDEMLAINVGVHTKLTKDYCHVIERQKRGRVIEFSSLAEAGSVGQGVYPGAKAYANSMTRSLGAEYALRFIRDRDANVAFASIVIGYVPGTHMTGYLRERQNRRKEERIRALTRDERDLMPSEVAAVGAHLLNPKTPANGKVVSIMGRGRVIA